MGAHEIANTLLICVVVVVSIYIIMNIDDTFTAFKKLYNVEQDDKHLKMGKHLSQLSNNDNELRIRGDSHEKKIDYHGDLLKDDKENRSEKKVYKVLDGHDSMLINHASLLNDTKTDRVEKSIYQLIDNQQDNLTSNNSKITENERKLKNIEFADGAGGNLVIKNANHDGNNNIVMKADGSIEFNVTDPSKLCSRIDGSTDCKPFVVLEKFGNNKLKLNNNVEKFAGLQIGDTGKHIELKYAGKTYELARTGTLEKGTTGDKGNKGDIGSRGEKGDTGERGAQGIEGKQGIKGDLGAIGEKGGRGERGDKGDAGLSERDIQTIIDTKLLEINEKVTGLSKIDNVILNTLRALQPSTEGFRNNGTKLSNYDRFLVKNHLIELFNNPTLERAKELQVNIEKASKEATQEQKQETVQNKALAKALVLTATAATITAKTVSNLQENSKKISKLTEVEMRIEVEYNPGNNMRGTDNWSWSKGKGNHNMGQLDSIQAWSSSSPGKGEGARRGPPYEIKISSDIVNKKGFQIEGLITQSRASPQKGAARNHQYIRSIRLWGYNSKLNSRKKWSDYNYYNLKQNRANTMTGRNERHLTRLRTPIIADKIHIRPHNWHVHPSIRMGLLISYIVPKENYENKETFLNKNSNSIGLCINNTCLTEKDIKKIKGLEPVYITHDRGMVLQGANDGRGNAQFTNYNNGAWERMYLK